MTAFVIAQMTVHDPDRYQRYASAVPQTLPPYDGRLLAVDHAPEVIEGDWPYRKVVVIAFPDRDRARAWAHGPEYAAIIADRRAASDAVGLVVQGFDT